MKTSSSDNYGTPQAASTCENSSLAVASCATHKGLLVILSAVVLAWGICGCSDVSERKQQELKRQQQLENYRKAISVVLQADHQASDGVTSKICVERYERIVRNMSSINLRGCPQQFTTAYRKHVDAWRKTISLIRRAENLSGWGNILESVAIGVFAGYTGLWELIGGKIASDSHEVDEIKAQGSQVDAEIASTYKEVLRIADTYGVDTRPYRARQ